jgi:hypothetical protein
MRRTLIQTVIVNAIPLLIAKSSSHFTQRG